MKIKNIAGGAFLLNTFLYGSYYAISKEVLGRVDPIVFSFFEMMTLVPLALVILIWSWRHITRQAVKSGFILGSCLCLGLFMLAIALRYNSATGTAFFPALNGLLAVIFTWVFLRQPIAKVTWFAGLVSVTGAILLMANADMGGLRGNLIALIGGLFCTIYIFLADHEQKHPVSYWPLLAIELLTMALWGNLIALLFGDWNMANFVLPKDGFVLLYIGWGTVFLPTLITVLLQKHISPVTVSFITILEPILGAIVAHLYLHEVLPLDGYIGGGMIVAGVLIHTWGSIERPSGRPAVQQRLKLMEVRFHTSPIAMLCYPLICCGIGAYIVSRVGGFPPPVWRELIQTLPQLSTLLQQGQGTAIGILLAQSFSWLIAWGSLLIMGGLGTFRALEKLFMGESHQQTITDLPTMPPIGANHWHEPAYSSAFPVSRRISPVTMGRRIPPSQHEAQEATMTGSMQPQKESINLDVRALKQMGYTPYSVSAHPTKKKPSVVEIQQRRLKHRIRLAQIEAQNSKEVFPDGLITDTAEKQEAYNDVHGNAYLYWNELHHTQDAIIPSRDFYLNHVEEVQEES